MNNPEHNHGDEVTCSWRCDVWQAIRDRQIGAIVSERMKFARSEDVDVKGELL